MHGLIWEIRQQRRRFTVCIYSYLLGGDQAIPLEYCMDFNYTSPEQTVGLRQQRPDFDDQVVYDKVVLDTDAFWEEPLDYYNTI